MAQFSRAKAGNIADDFGGGTDPNFILAVADVESGGRSDLPDGRPQILFEAQWFHNLTHGVYDASHPGISSPYWNKSLYKGGAAEYDRLNEAMALNSSAALRSASWGLFQIMGFNAEVCGFPGDVEGFVEFIKGPDDNDMIAFSRFVRSNPNLLRAVQRGDSRTFAEIYNGPGQIDYYANKIDTSRAQFASGADVAHVLSLSEVQSKIGVPVTGVWDDATHKGILIWQAAHPPLTVDGILGPMTRASIAAS